MYDRSPSATESMVNIPYGMDTLYPDTEDFIAVIGKKDSGRRARTI